MPSLDEHMLLAFRDALQKEAGYADLIQRATPALKNMGSLGGIGAGVGGAIGTVVGARKQYQAAREQGASRGQAALSGGLGALGGLGKGMMYGGVAGAGLGGAATLAGKDVASLAQREGVTGALSRYGQRQMHGATGMFSPQEFEKVRGGAWMARHGLETAKKTGVGVEVAAKRLQAVENAQNMGLTSLPGYVSALREHGPGKVLMTGAKERLTGMGTGNAMLTLGLPAYGIARTMGSREEADPTGKGKGERVGENIGRTVGGLTGGVLPMHAGVMLSRTLGGAGKYVGRGIDRLRGKGGQPGMGPTTLEPAEGQHMPSERVMSPAAAGQQPEVGL